MHVQIASTKYVFEYHKQCKMIPLQHPKKKSVLRVPLIRPRPNYATLVTQYYQNDDRRSFIFYREFLIYIQFVLYLRSFCVNICEIKHGHRDELPQDVVNVRHRFFSLNTVLRCHLVNSTDYCYTQFCTELWIGRELYISAYKR